MGMEDVLKIGLIGCGNVAQYGHSPAINGLDGIELVALADITPGAAHDWQGLFRLGR